MNIWRILSRMTNESEQDLKHIFSRATSLVNGTETPSGHMAHKGQPLSGRIFLITTWRVGKGEEDFLQILKREHHKVTKIIRLNWLYHKNKALVFAINNNLDLFSSGDIIAIARGGGDTQHEQFSSFKDPAAREIIQFLTESKKAIVITGVGHSSDSFIIEEAATIKSSTPTDAAYSICDLLKP